MWCAVLGTVVTRTRIWQSAGGGRHSAATQPLDTRYINTADRYTDNMSLWQVPSCGRDRSLTPDSWQSPPSSHRLAFVQTQHIYISIDIYTRIFSVSSYLCIYSSDNNDLLVSEDWRVSESDECDTAKRTSTNNQCDEWSDSDEGRCTSIETIREAHHNQCIYLLTSGGKGGKA